MKKLTLVAFILSACINIHSQTWQSFGVPPGGGVTDLVYWEGVGANFSDKLWVTTSSENWPTGQWGGVYYSATTPPYQGVWYQVAGGYIARTIEVGQDGNLYASIWQEPAFTDADALCRFTPQAGIFGTLYEASAGDNIFSIAVKNSPHTIFAGTRNGVIRSTDNGVNFGYSNTGIPDSAWVYDIAIDSSGILAVASSKGVFISTNNGDNWLTTTGIPPEDTVKTLLFISNSIAQFSNKKSLMVQNQDALFLGTNLGKLYICTVDNGYGNAIPVYVFSDAAEIADMEYDDLSVFFNTWLLSGRASQNIFNSGGVYESTDRGKTWNPINNGLPPEPPVSALALKIVNENFYELYAGLFNGKTNGAGVYKLDITVDVEEDGNEIPSEYLLEQNYPNPFNPSTIIQFAIPEKSFVKLEVFNALGESISTLVSEELNAGNYKYDWNATNLPSGIYFYKLSANSFGKTSKMLLLK